MSDEIGTVELLKTFTKRLDNPILSTLVVSFVIYNWKFFYILFVPFTLPGGVNRVSYSVSTLDVINHKIFGITFVLPAFLIVPLLFTAGILYLLPFLLRKYESWPIKQNALALEYKATQEADTEQKIFEKRTQIQQLNKQMLTVLDSTFRLREKVYTHAEYGINPNTDITTIYKKTNELEKNYTAKLILLIDELSKMPKNGIPLIKIVDSGTTTTYDDGTTRKNYSLSRTEEAISFMKMYLKDNEISDEELKSNFRKVILTFK